MADLTNAELRSENARLSAELRDALQRETAAADILAAISSSEGHLKSVFDTIVDRTTCICDATFSCLALFEGDALRFAAISGASANAEFFQPNRLHQPGGCPYVVPLARARTTAQTLDLRTEKGYLEHDPFYVTAVDTGGARTALRVPLLRNSRVLGHLWAFRQDVDAFSDKQIELISHFARQAVIAIENARLFEAEQARTRELSEALEQQTATSEVLQVINASPGNLAPVFDAMLAKATQLCNANLGIMWTYDGEAFTIAAERGTPRPSTVFGISPARPGPTTALARIERGKQVLHIPDMM